MAHPHSRTYIYLHIHPHFLFTKFGERILQETGPEGSGQTHLGSCHHLGCNQRWLHSLRKPTLLESPALSPHPALRHRVYGCWFSQFLCIPHPTPRAPRTTSSMGGSHKQLVLSSHPQGSPVAKGGAPQFLLPWGKRKKPEVQPEGNPNSKGILPHPRKPCPGPAD